MIVSRSHSRYGNFGAFGDYYGRPGDSWDKWCNAAADVWAQVGSTPDEAEALRHKCVDCNKAGVTCHAGQVPWTLPGLLIRGLPAAFSSNPDIASAGVLGKVRQTAGSIPGAGDLPIIGPILGGGTTVPADANIGGGGGGGGGGGLFTSPKKTPIALYIGGAALGLTVLGGLAFAFTRPRRAAAPAMAGYRRRRSRR